MSSAPPALSPAEEALATKFRAMLKAGVPEQAVRNKMAAEGAPAAVTAAVFGGAEEAAVETGGTEKWTGRRDRSGGGGGPAGDASCAASGEGNRRRASNLLTLHWTPLSGLSEEMVRAAFLLLAFGRSFDTAGLQRRCPLSPPRRLKPLWSK